MSVNINLVDKRTSEESKTGKVKKLRRISFVILFLTAILSIVIFLIDYRFSAGYVKKQEADLLKSLDSYNDTSAKIFIVNSKLSDISQVISKRRKFNSTVSQISSLGSASSVSVDQFLINDSGTSITISSDNLDSINSFLNSLIDLHTKQIIGDIVLKSLSLGSGKYVVQFTIT